VIVEKRIHSDVKNGGGDMGLGGINISKKSHHTQNIANLRHGDRRLTGPNRFGEETKEGDQSQEKLRERKMGGETRKA